MREYRLVYGSPCGAGWLRKTGMFTSACRRFPLPTGDSPQLPPGGTATAGLETAAMGKGSVPFKTQLPATKDLATARGGETVFSNIHTHGVPFGDRVCVGEVQNQIKEPLPLAANQFRFFGLPGRHQVGLMFSAYKWHGLTARQREQRNRTLPQGIGAMVVMHRSPIKDNRRNRFIPGNSLIGLERSVSAGNPVNGITGHLASQIREAFPNAVIGKMVQSDLVPASVFHGKWHDHGACAGECGRKLRQFRGLPGVRNQFQGYCALHIGNSASTKIVWQIEGDAGLKWV